MTNRNFLFLCIFLCIFLHFCSAFLSIGFYSDDEHFQILEPAAYLLGINEILIDDPRGYYWEWESHASIRPWLQPYLYFHFINLLKFFNINDPFQWTLILKIISSIFGLLSIIYLFNTFKNKFFQKNIRFNYFLFFSFWFYPFLHSRTSSENLGITVFIFCFCFFYKLFQEKKLYSNQYLFLFSFLLGISMVVRFNLIFTIFPLMLWILFYRFNFFKLFLISIGILFALIFGLLIDYINYGDFKITYYQFYKHNLGKDGAFNTFEIEPWYYFFTETIIQLAPILSLIFVLSVIVFWIKKYNHILAWISFFTILFISSFGHKELRYIFPIYVFAPLFIAYFFENYSFKFSNILKSLIIFSNIIFLFLTVFTPANTKVGVYQFVYYNIEKDEKIYYLDENPYLVNEMEPFFYTNFLPEIKNFELKKEENKYWIVTNKISNYEKYNIYCQKKYSTYPSWLFNLNENWKRHRLNWYIMYCK